MAMSAGLSSPPSVRKLIRAKARVAGSEDFSFDKKHSVGPKGFAKPIASRGAAILSKALAPVEAKGGSRVPETPLSQLGLLAPSACPGPLLSIDQSHDASREKASKGGKASAKKRGPYAKSKPNRVLRPFAEELADTLARMKRITHYDSAHFQALCDIARDGETKSEHAAWAIKSVAQHNFEWLTKGKRLIVRKEQFVNLPTSQMKEAHFQEVVPTDRIEALIESAHTAVGHASPLQTWQQLSVRYFNIPRNFVELWCKTCKSCCGVKRQKKPSASLRPILGDSVWGDASMDLVDMTSSTAEYRTHAPGTRDEEALDPRWFLTYRDRLTQFTVVKTLRNKKGETVARALEEIFAEFGPPRKLLADNGGEFINAVVEEMLERWGVRLRHTGVRKPSTNGSCERANGIIKTRLASAADTTHKGLPWWLAVPMVLFKMNATVSRTSGFAPFRLMFQQDPPLLVKSDAADDIDTEDALRDEDVTDLAHGTTGQFGMRIARELATQHLQLQRMGVSGASSNCAILSTYMAINAPLVDGKDVCFRDVSHDQQIALALGERKRIAQQITQSTLDLAFVTDDDADADEKGSIPELKSFCARLSSPGDMDERVFVLLSAMCNVNIFVVRLYVEHDGQETVATSTCEFFGGFRPQRRTIALYNRFLRQVEKVIEFDELSDGGLKERWRNESLTSGHLEVIADAELGTNWDAESPIVRGMVALARLRQFDPAMGSLVAAGHSERVMAKRNQARAGKHMKLARERKISSRWAPSVGDVVAVVIPSADRVPLGPTAFPAVVVECKPSGVRVRMLVNRLSRVIGLGSIQQLPEFRFPEYQLLSTKEPEWTALPEVTVREHARKFSQPVQVESSSGSGSDDSSGSNNASGAAAAEGAKPAISKTTKSSIKVKGAASKSSGAAPAPRQQRPKKAKSRGADSANGDGDVDMTAAASAAEVQDDGKKPIRKRSQPPEAAAGDDAAPEPAAKKPRQSRSKLMPPDDADIAMEAEKKAEEKKAKEAREAKEEEDQHEADMAAIFPHQHRERQHLARARRSSQTDQLGAQASIAVEAPFLNLVRNYKFWWQGQALRKESEKVYYQTVMLSQLGNKEVSVSEAVLADSQGATYCLQVQQLYQFGSSGFASGTLFRIVGKRLIEPSAVYNVSLACVKKKLTIVNLSSGAENPTGPKVKENDVYLSV